MRAVGRAPVGSRVGLGSEKGPWPPLAVGEGVWWLRSELAPGLGAAGRVGAVVWVIRPRLSAGAFGTLQVPAPLPKSLIGKTDIRQKALCKARAGKAVRDGKAKAGLPEPNELTALVGWFCFLKKKKSLYKSNLWKLFSKNGKDGAPLCHF